MGTRIEEGAKADSCFNKAAMDEPIFVLRAQDKLAPDVIRIWCILAGFAGVPDEKVTEARQLATDMQI